MDSRESWEPPIATLPRQTHRRLELGTALAPALRARTLGWSARGGFVRQAAQTQRRLGWLLWSGLVALVLLLSST